MAFGQLDLDYKDYVDVDPRYFRPAEVDVLQGDIAKARRVLEWSPSVSFTELVSMMVAADMKLAQQEAILREHGVFA